MQPFDVRCTDCRRKITLRINPWTPRKMWDEGYRTSGRYILFCPECADKSRPENTWARMIEWWNGALHDKADREKDHKKISAMMKDPETGLYIEY